MDPKQYVYTDQTWRRPSAPCTEVEIHRSLALLGINSWEELEQGKFFCCYILMVFLGSLTRNHNQDEINLTNNQLSFLDFCRHTRHW